MNGKARYASGAIFEYGKVICTVDGTSFDCTLTAAQQEAMGNRIVTALDAQEKIKELMDVVGIACCSPDFGGSMHALRRRAIAALEALKQAKEPTP